MKNENELKKMQRASLLKMIVIAVIVVVFVVFSSVAWFTMNREVEGAGVQMTADGLPFELEVRGEKIENQLLYSKIDNNFIAGVQQKNGEGTLISSFQTAGDETHGTILWNKDASADGSYSDGLEPNAQGTLTFWVVPQKSGELNVKFNFNVRGFHAKYTTDAAHSLVNAIEITSALDTMTAEQLAVYDLTVEKLPSKHNALAYIQSHILFFKNYDNGHYSGFLGNAGNKVDFKDCLPDGTDSVTEGQKYQVTIYWKWANTLEQTVSYADSPLLDSTAETYAVDRAAILAYLADYTHHKVFDNVTDSVITTNIAKLQNASTADDKEALTALTNKYNNADEVIGNNLNYILLEMTTSTS